MKKMMVEVEMKVEDISHLFSNSSHILIVVNPL